MAKYVISTDIDRITGNKFYYCHQLGYPNIPVFGSIGSYQKAKSVMNMMNARHKNDTKAT